MSSKFLQKYLKNSTLWYSLYQIKAPISIKDPDNPKIKGQSLKGKKFTLKPVNSEIIDRVKSAVKLIIYTILETGLV